MGVGVGGCCAQSAGSISVVVTVNGSSPAGGRELLATAGRLGMLSVKLYRGPAPPLPPPGANRYNRPDAYRQAALTADFLAPVFECAAPGPTPHPLPASSSPRAAARHRFSGLSRDGSEASVYTVAIEATSGSKDWRDVAAMAGLVLPGPTTLSLLEQPTATVALRLQLAEQAGLEAWLAGEEPPSTEQPAGQLPEEAYQGGSTCPPPQAALPCGVVDARCQ